MQADFEGVGDYGAATMKATFRNAVFVATLGTLCLGSGPALADCKGLSILASVDLAKAADVRPFVPVTFGDKRKIMLIDTGGSRTEMTSQLADELHLKRHKRFSKITEFGGRVSKDIVHVDLNPDVYDLAGRVSNEAVATGMSLGGLSAGGMSFYVMPDDEQFSHEADAGGLIAADVLSNYDLDIDFGARKLNLISPDHCEGKVIYWKADGVAVVPFRKMRSGRIAFTVTLDGKDVVADLDTGAENTMLTRRSATVDYGLQIGDADTPQIGTLPGGESTVIYRHQFKTLNFGGVVISNPEVVVIPDLTRAAREREAAPPLGSRLSDARIDETAQAMRIGMDILKHLHIYVAYGEQKLYITAAGPHA